MGIACSSLARSARKSMNRSLAASSATSCANSSSSSTSITNFCPLGATTRMDSRAASSSNSSKEITHSCKLIIVINPPSSLECNETLLGSPKMLDVLLSAIRNLNLVNQGDRPQRFSFILSQQDIHDYL